MWEASGLPVEHRKQLVPNLLYDLKSFRRQPIS
jgi:hypothetical protein